MNTESLRYIIAIAEFKSINKAAKELYISQPTLSRILQNVEDSTGITIFIRNNRGVEPTKEGEAFIHRINDMLAELDKIENDYFNHDNPPDDLVTLIIGAHRSSPALDAFIRYYKDRCSNSNHINLVFQEETAEKIIEGVYKGIINLGVIHYISSKEDYVLQECMDKKLECSLVDDGALCVQISRNHPLATKRQVAISDLKPFTHVTFSDEDLSGINYCSNISKFNWHTQGKRIVINSRGTLRSLILNTDGYYLGNNAQCKLLDLEETVSIPVADYPYRVKTIYIHHKERELTEEERIYLKYLSDIYHSDVL